MNGTANFQSMSSLEAANDAMFEVARKIKADFGLEETIEEAAKQNNVFLTPAAYLILVAPIIDAKYLQLARNTHGIHDPDLDIGLETIQRSIEQIIREPATTPALADRSPNERNAVDEDGNTRPLRSSLSLIRAMWRQFCDIPPFCSKTE